MKTNKTIWGITLFVLFSFLVISCSGPKQEEQKVVKIAYLPVIQSLPLYLSIEKGYFKEAGIDIEAIKFESPNQVIDALLSGQVQFGAAAASGITAVSEAAKPGSLKIFAVIGGDFSIINDLLLVKSDSSIQSIKELKGKKLGILPGIQFRTIAKQILTNEGLLPDKDVTIVELAVQLQVQALASGQIDALLTIEPIGTIGKSKKVAKDLIKSPMVQYISNPWYGAVLDVSTQFVKDNPKTTKKVLDVFDRAINEINQDPPSSKQYLKSYTPLTEDLIAQVPLPIFKMCTNLTDVDIESLQKFFDIFTKHKVVDGRIDPRSLLYC